MDLMKLCKTLALSEEVVNEMDRERGDIPRSRFADRLLREALEQRRQAKKSG